MQTKIQKWGNSLAVRIPKPFVKEASIAYGTSIDLSVTDGKIVISPIINQKYELDNLLKGINKKNIHAEIITGDAVGQEAW